MEGVDVAVVVVVATSAVGAVTDDDTGRIPKVIRNPPWTQLPVAVVVVATLAVRGLTDDDTGEIP